MEHTGLLFLFTCQPTKSSNFSRSGVNVRAHLLRKNYSGNFSSIRSTPISLEVQEGNVIWHKTLRMLKFHPIPAFMKTYTNFKKKLWLGFFGQNIFFELNLKFPF